MLCCTMLHTTRLDKNGQNNSSSTRYLYRKKRISSKTNMTRSFIAVFVVVFLIRKGVTGVLTNVPSNAVAEVGGQAIFNCTSSLTLQNWIFAKSRDDVSASLGQDIAVNCAIQPGFETHYEVDRPGGSTNVCNLIVKATTMQQAGTYTCSDTVYGPSAILTVIDPILVLTRNSTTAQEEAVEGESVMFECVLNYNGTIEPTPTLRPYFYWTNSTGENITSYSDSTTENKAVSQFEVTAQRGNNITAYTCHVYFKLNLTNTPNYASNTPAVNISDSSRTIEVLYVPSTPIITNRTGVIGINGVLCGISILTCSSSGNPVPSYRWFDSVQTLLSSNDTLDLAEINRSYKCEAYNTIRNVIHEASAEHNVTKGNCFSTVDCCEFPHNETTKLTDKGCINGTAQCDCSQGNSVIALFCNATTYPNASYIWSGPGISDVPSNSAVFDKVSANGTYTCIAYFDRTSSNYSGDVIFTNGTDNATVNECSASATPEPTTSSFPSTTLKTSVSSTLTSGANTTEPGKSTDGMVAGIVIGCYILSNIIATCFFICCYAGCCCMRDTISCLCCHNPSSNWNHPPSPPPPTAPSGLRTRNEDVKEANKIRLNKRFPWLQKMLPCMNNSRESTGTKVLWVSLFVLLGTFAGIFVFPTLVIVAMKYESNNETSALTKRENGGEGNEGVGNGRRPGTDPLSPNQTRAQGHYQNESTNDIELKISHQSGDRPKASPKPITSPTGKPPAPPDKKNLRLSDRANIYVTTEPGQSPEYAELPIAKYPSTKPVQYMDDQEDSYAALKKT